MNVVFCNISWDSWGPSPGQGGGRKSSKNQIGGSLARCPPLLEIRFRTSLRGPLLSPLNASVCPPEEAEDLSRPSSLLLEIHGGTFVGAAGGAREIVFESHRPPQVRARVSIPPEAQQGIFLLYNYFVAASTCAASQLSAFV